MADRRDPAAKVVNLIHRSLFTATKGKLGGKVMGMEALVLTTTGRKTGEKRQTMLTAPITDGDKVYLVASWGGGPKHPMWFLNLQADPNVQITRDGTDTKNYVGRIVSAEEKATLWPRITEAYKGYAGYQEKTDRDIPVIEFTPA
ncbi:MAG: nitroreductase family deazaflavin-dependent oxidoreductase [Acidimicrobiales bacterium]|nr:nitroreductase family deazaflavin-dependent oxidoreductase [Acidimicrobiales bacterium]